MSFIICKELAPPEIVAMLQGLHFNNSDLTGFMQRTIDGAKAAGLSVKDAEGEMNSRAIMLMLILQSSTIPEPSRRKILEGPFLDDYLECAPDLDNWDGIALLSMFASSNMLNRMVELIPRDIFPDLIAMMDPDMQPIIRSKLLN